MSDEKKSKRARRSRTKGREWQAELAKRWRDNGLFPSARSTHGEQVRDARLGARPPDIEGTGLWVEAKHKRAADPIGALRQAILEQEDAGDTRPPIAVVKPHNDRVCGPVVVMRLDDWEQLLMFARDAATAILTTPVVAVVMDEETPLPTTDPKLLS